MRRGQRTIRTTDILVILNILPQYCTKDICGILVNHCPVATKQLHSLITQLWRQFLAQKLRTNTTQPTR